MCVCLILIHYVSGVSEGIKRVCHHFNITFVYKSVQSFRSISTRAKDKLPSSMHSLVMYCIPCSCGKVYTIETRINEHKDSCKKSTVVESAVSEHVWWDETTVIDQAGRQTRLSFEESIAHPSDT